MKRIIRSIAIEAVVIYLISAVTKGLIFEGGMAAILVTGLALALASFLVKPVVNILLLPINLVTFGLFKWLGNAVTLYVVDLVLSQFRVENFVFAGLTNEWFTLPAYSSGSIIVSYILFSFLIFFASSILYWLAD